MSAQLLRDGPCWHNYKKRQWTPERHVPSGESCSHMWEVSHACLRGRIWHNFAKISFSQKVSKKTKNFGIFWNFLVFFETFWENFSFSQKKRYVPFLFLSLYCVLKMEAFVVALIWSPRLICATDWILKYTPSRVLQTMDTNRKRLKLEQQCLTRDYQFDVWCVQRRNFCRSWGATLQLDAFLERHRLWARNLWSI